MICKTGQRQDCTPYAGSTDSCKPGHALTAVSVVILLVSTALAYLYPVLVPYRYLITALPALLMGYAAGPVCGAAGGIVSAVLTATVFSVSDGPGAVPLSGGLGWIGAFATVLFGAAGGVIRSCRTAVRSARTQVSIRDERIRELEQELDRQETYVSLSHKARYLGSWELDLGTMTIRLSGQLPHALGLAPDTTRVPYASIIEAVHPEDRTLLESLVGDVLVGGSREIEHRIVHGNETRTVCQRLRIIHDQSGMAAGIAGVVQDISEIRAMEDEMRKLTLALHNSKDWIVITDAKGRIEYVNGTVTEVTGFSKDEILSNGIGIWKSGIHGHDFYHTLWDTIQRGDSFRGVFICRKKDAELFYLDQTIIAVKDKSGRVVNFIGTAKDVTQTRQMEERLKYLAYYDALTNLPNRQLFTDRIRHALVQSRLSGTVLGIVSLDINRFRLINDSYGPKIGDEVLKAVASRLSASVHEGDTVARLGNDEWGIVLTGMYQTQGIAQSVETILRDSGRPYRIDEEEILLSLCAGVALYPEDGRTATELVRNAEIALMKAKESGSSRYMFFTADLNRRVSEFIQKERELFRAIENNEFVLHYQPYFQIETGRCTGMEALLRWNRAELGIVLPAEFIPILEETGMIIDAGQQIIRMAAAQVRSWLDAGYEVPPVSINLSGLQFRRKDLAASIETIVGEYRIEPASLAFEITESTFMQNLERTRATLYRLRELGFSLSIDDFGTGYSSLSYLKRFPIDTLKIDKSFVDGLTNRTDDLPIVRAIISMAKSLSLRTIAEGVETETALDILKNETCDFAQGYYFSPPVSPEQFERRFFDRPDVSCAGKEDLTPRPV